MSSNAEKRPKVKLTITPGPVTPYMKRCWGLFWRHLVSEAIEKAHPNEKNQ